MRSFRSSTWLLLDFCEIQHIQNLAKHVIVDADQAQIFAFCQVLSMMNRDLRSNIYFANVRYYISRSNIKSNYKVLLYKLNSTL